MKKPCPTNHSHSQCGQHRYSRNNPILFIIIIIILYPHSWFIMMFFSVKLKIFLTDFFLCSQKKNQYNYLLKIKTASKKRYICWHRQKRILKVNVEGKTKLTVLINIDIYDYWKNLKIPIQIFFFKFFFKTNEHR